MLSAISSLAVSSSAEVERPRAAAFFDLDKTIIAKSSTLAYGPSFYRNGLISRGDAIRGAVAQLLFSRHGASHDRMEQIRAHVSQLCRGWPADRVRDIVARHLDELIVPYVYDEARALLDAHGAAGEDVIIVSTSGIEMVGPIGALLGAALVIATQMEIAEGRYTGRMDFYAYGPAKAERVGDWRPNVVTGWPTAPPTAIPLLTCRCWRRWGTGEVPGESGPGPAPAGPAPRLAHPHLQRASSLRPFQACDAPPRGTAQEWETGERSR